MTAGDQNGTGPTSGDRPYTRSVVVPVYDERASTVSRVVGELLDRGWDEVVVCVDRPDDALRGVLSGDLDLPTVVASVSETRRGKGGALLDGLSAAGGEVLGFVDADGAVPVGELDRIYRVVEGGDADVAVGARGEGARRSSLRTAHRWALGKSYRWLVATLLDVPVDDVQCGAKAFSRAVWDAIGDDLDETGFAFDTELVARADHGGFAVAEVPIEWSDPGRSSVDPVRDVPRMVGALARIRRSIARDATRQAESKNATMANGGTETATGDQPPPGAEAGPPERRNDGETTREKGLTDGGASTMESSPAETVAPAERREPIDLALVTAHPPDRGHLAEYGEQLARAYQERDDLNVTVVSTDVGDAPDSSPEYEVKRVWRRDSLLGAGALVRELLSGRYDAVHFNLHMTYFGTKNVYRFVGLGVPPVVAAISDVPVVTTLHDMLEIVSEGGVDQPVGPVKRAGARLATQLLLRTDATTVTSEAYRREIHDRYVPNRVYHVPHGAFPTHDDLERVPGRNDAFRVLVFGHLGPTKDVGTVVEAVDVLADRHDDVELVVAGDSHPQHPGHREALVAAYGDRPYVRFVGYVPDEELDAVWSRASVVVIPYRTCTGVSGVYQLAKSFATPAVVFDAEGMRNSTVGTGGEAAFVPPGDPDALADELSRLRENPDRRRRLARANAAAAEVTIDDVADRIVSIIREVADD